MPDDRLLHLDPPTTPSPEAPPAVAVAKSPWPRRLLRIGLSLAALGLCVALFRRLDPEQVLGALAGADWRLIALAVLLNLTINTGGRVLRWAALLAPLPRRGNGPGLGELSSLLLASYATSNLLPARAGEALRTVQLHRRHGFSVAALVAVQLVEKILEALSLALLALPAALIGHPPAAMRLPLFAFAVLAIGGVALVLAIAWRSDGGAGQSTASDGGEAQAKGARAAIRRFLGRLGEAMHLLRAPRIWSVGLAWSCLADLADVAMLGLCLVAVGIHLPLASWLVVFLAINLAISLPSTPAQIGVLEAGAVLALVAVGAGRSESLAFAVLYHAAHVLPTTLVGLIGLRHESQAAVAPAGTR